MQREQLLDTIPLEELVQELRVRGNLVRAETPHTPVATPGPLADIDTAQILETVIAKQKVIYGVDNRQDLFAVADQAILDSADSVVSLWQAADITDNGNGTSTLQTQNFGVRENLCASERFRNQPVGAFCSGFLVAPDIIATAGHCVNAGNVTNTRFVFGYRMTNAANAQTTISNSEIYRGASVIDRRLTNGDNADWTLVRLDRSVTNHRITTIRRTGTIGANQAVYVIGHPVGLPIKYAPGANVRDNAPVEFFVANLDTYGGNSGSPVFNANTHTVEGILVRGETDFVPNGSCMVSLVCPTNGCRGEDCTKTTRFDHLVPTLLQGRFTFQQVVNNRFLDAHEGAANDFAAVTRPAQNNDSQQWRLTPVGAVYTIRQVLNNRFLDAHETADNDFAVVTRTAQNNDSQRWVLLYQNNNQFTIQQMNTARFMDAHDNEANDFAVVMRTAQNNNTQRWRLNPLGDDRYTIQQVSNNRFLDAHEDATNDFAAVTRTAQNNDSQRWQFTFVAGVYTIRQESNGRFLDAHENATNDFAAVTRTAQNNDTQRWILRPLGNNRYTVQQMSNGRFLDAHEDAANDFAAVTRTAQNNPSQQWTLTAL